MMRVVADKPLTISEMARLGGKARAKNMTPEQRKESARKAVNARWDKERKELRDIQRSTRKVVKQGERLLKKTKKAQ
jgi:hypothetical protein